MVDKVQNTEFMVGKKPSKRQNPQNFKDFALYFHFLGSHGRQGRHRTMPLYGISSVKSKLSAKNSMERMIFFTFTLFYFSRFCRYQMKLESTGIFPIGVCSMYNMLKQVEFLAKKLSDFYRGYHGRNVFSWLALVVTSKLSSIQLEKTQS